MSHPPRDDGPVWKAQRGRPRTRLIAAAALALAIVTGIVAASLLGSGEEDATAPVDPDPWVPDVTVHVSDNPTLSSNIWTGVIYAIVDGTPIYLADGENPAGVVRGDPLDMIVEEEIRVSGRRALHRVQGFSPGRHGSSVEVEMIWTSGVGVDGTYELDAALERPVSTGYRLHLQCSSPQESVVVAVVDEDLEAQAAWQSADLGGHRFEEISPIGVLCW